MHNNPYFVKLEKLYSKVPTINITNDDKIVIFSDLHIGNGTNKDDFFKNSEIFLDILENYYLKKDYKLILNGDIEDLYKFSLNKIIKKWGRVFEIFEKFAEKDNLFKIVGNHDHDLYLFKKPDINKNLLTGLKLFYNDNHIFIYHGQQVSNYFEEYNRISFYFIRYIACPMGISNSTISIDNKKKLKTEERAYEYSAQKKIISIIGHTHRALFESLSKIDTLNMKIERLIQKYAKVKPEKQERIVELINRYKEELQHWHSKHEDFNLRNSIYNEKILVPCLFNSGTVIGKRGMNCIEIKNGKIALIYWFDKNKSQRYLNYKGVKVKQFGDTDVMKAIIKEQTLDYVFNRINLLS